MADYNNNSGSNNKLFENTYYSRFKIKNYKSNEVLSIYYRSGLMYFELGKTTENFKVDSVVTICFSPMKAHILVNEIKRFREYRAGKKIDPMVAFGVNTGMGDKVSYIGFHTNERREILVTIGKINGNGEILESHTFPLNFEANYGLEWSNIQKMSLEKAMDEDAEIIMIQNVLADFSRASNGAIAYSVADLTRYDNARILRKMDPIYDKLGIERLSGGNRNYGGTNNFLENTKASSNHVSYDSIEEMLDND